MILSWASVGSAKSHHLESILLSTYLKEVWPFTMILLVELLQKAKVRLKKKD